MPTWVGVMDGHGVEGAEVSTEAADLLPHLFFTSLPSPSPTPLSHSVPCPRTRPPPPPPPPSAPPSVTSATSRDAFQSAFAMADHIVCEEKGFRGGSTACCAYTAPRRDGGYTLHVAAVGDSRAVLLSAARGPRVLTVDHSTTSLSEQARITAAGGHLLFSHCSLRVNGVLNVTRSIGDRALKQFVISEPEQTTVELQEDDGHLLLITDGITNVLDADDLHALVNDLPTAAPADIADSIVDLALKKGTKDNVTAVVIHLPTYMNALRTAGDGEVEGEGEVAAGEQPQTPPPSRERGVGLPPVPPFTISPTPSSPMENGADSDGGVCEFIPPPLTKRSSLSASFFAMVPRQARGGGGGARGVGGGGLQGEGKMRESC